MTDIADNVIAVQTAVAALTEQVTALTTAVSAIVAPAAVDLTPVLDGIAAIKAALEPTPAVVVPAA